LCSSEKQKKSYQKSATDYITSLETIISSWVASTETATKNNKEEKKLDLSDDSDGEFEIENCDMKKEFKDYINEPKSDNLIEFWKSRVTKYPYLFRVKIICLVSLKFFYK
jgi:hypothetical protein